VRQFAFQEFDQGIDVCRFHEGQVLFSRCQLFGT